MISKIIRPNTKNLVSNIFSKFIFNFSKSKNIKIPEINQVKQDWNEYSQGYNKFDLGPQTFYYSFLSLMKMNTAKNVLEVACGNGRLLPVAIMLKNKNTNYLAVDIAENMIQRAKSNLKQNFQKYQSKISFEQWCKKQNLEFKVTNSQQKMDIDKKFDRIICNCVLMLTENPQKMLQSLYDQAESGCLMGISVWGNKENNNYMGAIRESIVKSGFELPNSRSNFHLYQKVSDMAQKIGWKTKLRWQQNALFPLIQFDFQGYKQFFMYQINKLPQNQREPVKKKLMQKIQKIFESKKGLNFSCQLYIFEKK